MKKLLVVLLTAALMLSVFCLGEEIDVSGAWYLSMITSGDQSVGAADLGITMTLVLNEDGTAMMESEAMDVLQDGTWAINEEGMDLTFDGETETAMLTEGCLVLIEDEEMQMTFSREEPIAFVAPEAAAAADIADFDGTWTMKMVGMEGTYVPADMMLEEASFLFGGSEPTVVIENGVVTAFGKDESETFTFEDGQLMLTLVELEEETEATEEVGDLLDQFIVLNEDGTITYTVFDMQIFCEKAA